MQVTLVDTAGLRESSDDIERQGMQRARAEVAGADIVALVQDASADGPMQNGTEAGPRGWDASMASLGLPEPWEGSSNGSPEDSGRHKRLLVVRNKVDVRGSSKKQPAEPGLPCCSISCRTGEGMDALLDTLSALVADVASAGDGQAGTLITRHVTTCYASCLQACAK
jgi:tRNA modification GTPase